jgi:hypothetical protein
MRKTIQVLALAFALSAPTYAGEVLCGVIQPPPPPPTNAASAASQEEPGEIENSVTAGIIEVVFDLLTLL